MSKYNDLEFERILEENRNPGPRPTILTGPPPCPPLHQYQKKAKDFCIRTPGCGLFLSCGLGKSLVTLDVLATIQPNRHVLIIAPKNIARSTWDQEIKKWGFRFRTMSLLVNKKGQDLPKKDREQRYEYLKTAPPTICFINREKIPGLVEWFGKQWPFPVVVIDEFQSFKSYKSSRFKALRKVRPYIRRVIGLTGTPMPKDMEDLYGQVTTLDDGERLGKNITAYRNTFFTPAPGRTTPQGYPYEWLPLPGAKEEIFRRIREITISMENKELKIPPVTYVVRKDSMLPDERALYDRLKKEHILELEDGSAVTPGNAAVLAGKLSQMSSGTLYVPDPEDDTKRNVLAIHGHKLDMCQWILDNADGPVLIAYWFNCDRDRLMERFREYGMESFDGTPAMQGRWNRQEIPAMLIQPQSDGFGLNLQEGGHTLVWYTIPWSLEMYLQTNARIARQGQKHPVVIHQLCIEDTMDERIMMSIEKKDDSQKELLEAVKAVL